MRKAMSEYFLWVKWNAKIMHVPLLVFDSNTGSLLTLE